MNKQNSLTDNKPPKQTRYDGASEDVLSFKSSGQSTKSTALAGSRLKQGVLPGMGGFVGLSRMFAMRNLQGRLTTVASFCSDESNEAQDIDEFCRHIESEPIGLESDASLMSP